MKSYEEMAKCVLEARDSHNIKKKKRQTALKRCVPVAASLCCVVLVCLGVWHNMSKVPEIPTKPKSTETTNAATEPDANTYPSESPSEKTGEQTESPAAERGTTQGNSQGAPSMDSTNSSTGTANNNNQKNEPAATTDSKHISGNSQATNGTASQTADGHQGNSESPSVPGATASVPVIIEPTEPTAAEPTEPEPPATEPSAPEPPVTEPSASEPSSAMPSVPEPSAAEPSSEYEPPTFGEPDASSPSYEPPTDSANPPSTETEEPGYSETGDNIIYHYAGLDYYTYVYENAEEEVSADNIGDYIGTADMLGYYANTGNKCLGLAEAYKIKGVDKEAAIAIKFEGDSKYYLYYSI